MSAPLLPAPLASYLDGLVPARPTELAAMESEAADTDFPVIGPAAGHFCYLMARLTGAKAVFELGSGFGYSTAWFARAVLENGGGRVHHTVWDPALSKRARHHLRALKLDTVVTFRVGEAVQALRETDGPFDLIFNDIDKEAYPESLPVIAEKLRPGGLLIADNLLWHGRILDPADRSPATEGVRRFTEMVTRDPRWKASVVPIRDGLLVARRGE